MSVSGNTTQWGLYLLPSSHICDTVSPLPGSTGSGDKFPIYAPPFMALAREVTTWQNNTAGAFPVMLAISAPKSVLAAIAF